MAKNAISYSTLVFTLLFSLSILSSCAQHSDANLPVPPANAELAEDDSSVIINCVSSTDQTVPFVAIGDTGSGASFQFNVAKQMLKKYQQTPFPLVLMLGDNIYERGNIKKLSEQRFTKPYKPLLDLGIKFQPVLGNHDLVGGFGADQIKFFNMPGRYYTCKQGNTQFFAIDTSTFAKHSTQQEWLKKELAKSSAKWTVVYGHFPILTSGQHRGDGDIHRLRKKLLPIMKAHDVDLYLAGHDHNYERMTPFKENGKVVQIISGGGGAWLRNIKKRDPKSILYVKSHHFTFFEPSDESLSYTAIDATGKIIDQGKLSD